MFKSLLYIAILTTAIVASWVGFSVYHGYTTSTISADTNIRIAPIEAKFDQETIGILRSKRVIKANLSEGKTSLTITPQPTNGISSVSSQSGQPGL